MLTRAHQRSTPNTPNALEEHDSYWNISSLDTWQQGHIHIVDHNWQFVVLAIILVCCTCGGFLYSDNIRCVVLMCLIVCSFWLKPVHVEWARIARKK